MPMTTVEIVPVIMSLAAMAQSQQAQPPATASDQAPPPAAPPPHGSPSAGNAFLTVFLALVAALAFAYMLVRLFRSVRRSWVHGKGQARVGDLEAAPPKHERVWPETQAAAAAGAGPPEKLVKVKVIEVRVTRGLPRE